MGSVQFKDLRSGMRLWDNKERRWQKVLRVNLWEEILQDNPDRYFLKRQPGRDSDYMTEADYQTWGRL